MKEHSVYCMYNLHIQNLSVLPQNLYTHSVDMRTTLGSVAHADNNAISMFSSFKQGSIFLIRGDCRFVVRFRENQILVYHYKMAALNDT